MLLLKYLLITLGAALLASAAGILVYDLYAALRKRDMQPQGEGQPGPRPARQVRYRQATRVGLMALLPLLAGLSIIVIPSGFAGVCVSQISGARPGTLYPGVHILMPLIDSVALYDTRDAVYSTGAVPGSKQDETRKAAELLRGQTSDGLTVGFGVTVRYRLDPSRLYTVHTSMPPDVAGEVVAPVVASAFREASTSYSVREISTTKRESKFSL